MKLHNIPSDVMLPPVNHFWRRRARLSLLVASLATGLSLCGPISRADTPAAKTDSFLRPTLTAKSASGWTSVIVALDGALTPEQQVHFKSLGADLYRHLDLIHSVALRVPTRNLSRLAALPFVRHLSSDATVKKNDHFVADNSGATTAFQNNNLTGAGIGVAVVDTGVGQCADLEVPNTSTSRISGNINYVAGAPSAADQTTHGTHVAGIIAGNGGASGWQLAGGANANTFYGVARQANIINVRVLNTQGEGTVSNVVAGIQWCVTNKTAYNIRVMNLSLGHAAGDSYKVDPLCQAVEAAWKAGIVVCCAAGNDGRLNATVTNGVTANGGYGTAYGSIQCPGNDPYVITVGAMKRNPNYPATVAYRSYDQVATYSSRGPSRLDLVLKPDIVAPGNQIVSTDLGMRSAGSSYLDTTYPANMTIIAANSGHYFTLSGTSMATPVISGAAALLLQANPKLTPDTVKVRLMMSADKWADPSGNTDPCSYGAGYINIPAALQCTAVATQPAMSPTLSEDASGNVYINLNSNIWGTMAIWGTGINDLQAIWGTNAIWGTSANVLSGSMAIWGTGVWGDMAIWGTTTGAVDLSTVVIDGE